MRNFTNLFTHLIYIIFLCGSIQYCPAQNKFEFGVRIDPLVVPININTYEESGPGYYDINARGYINQAVYVDFSYWPHPNVGLSVGMGKRKFSSEIQYTIPDPSNLEPGSVVFDNSYPFSTDGLGPVVSILFRKDQFRARLGYAAFDLSKEQYTSKNIASLVTVFDGQEIIADILLEEISFWNTLPTTYQILQFDAQYYIIKNVFLKLGFETTLGGLNYYLYTLKISGFTANTLRVDQLLNDFKMRNTFASFSFGIGYNIGFGSYKQKL